MMYHRLIQNKFIHIGVPKLPTKVPTSDDNKKKNY